MDIQCSIEACKREAETFCYHCSQDVCSSHFLEHKKWVQEQVPSLVDEVNVIYDRLRHNDQHKKPPIPQCVTDAYNQLDKWRADSHDHIDTIYHEAQRQIETIMETCSNTDTQQIAKNFQSLEEMRQKLQELLKEGDITYKQLETMRQNLEEIRQNEQVLIRYPDIRVITRKIDVSKYIDITIDMKHSVDVQQRSTTMKTTSLHSESSVQHSHTLASPSEETVNECPMCYWTFPSHMTFNDKREHIHYHFS